MRIIITLRDILGLVGMIATLIFVLVVTIQEKLKNRIIIVVLQELLKESEE